MPGVVLRGKDCPANYPPSQTRWRTLRLVYDQARGIEPYANPTVFTDMIRSAESPYEDPGVATVMTSGVVSVRNLPIPTAQVNPANVDLGTDGGQLPPSTTNSPVAPLKTSGGGYATPQYRVEFNLGQAKATAFVDAGCMLSMPALSVSISALTQILLFDASDGPIVGGNVTGDLLTEALVSASVSWSKGGGGGAPQGMATFSQVGHTDGLAVVVFERPPFARRVQAYPPITVPGIFLFVSELGTLTALSAPPGVSNTVSAKWDVPHAAAGILFAPTALSTDQLVAVQWEIGVR